MVELLPEYDCFSHLPLENRDKYVQQEMGRLRLVRQCPSQGERYSSPHARRLDQRRGRLVVDGHL